MLRSSPAARVVAPSFAASLVICAAFAFVIACGERGMGSDGSSSDAGTETGVKDEGVKDEGGACADADAPAPGLGPSGDAAGAICDDSVVETAKDPCLSLGLACKYFPLGGASGSCAPPGDRALCDPHRCGVCGAGADCVLGAEDGPDGYGRCLRSCATSESCGSGALSCAASGDGRARCTLKACDSLLTACDVDGKGDGQCLPFGTVDLTSGTVESSRLVCFATGSRALDEPCTIARGAQGSTALCAKGLLCHSATTDDAGNDGFCRPIAVDSSSCDGVLFSLDYLFYVEGKLLQLYPLCLRACVPPGDGGAGMPCPVGRSCLAAADDPAGPFACF